MEAGCGAHPADLLSPSSCAFPTRFPEPLISWFSLYLIGFSFLGALNFSSLHVAGLQVLETPWSFLPHYTHFLSDLIQSHAFTNTCQQPPHPSQVQVSI